MDNNNMTDKLFIKDITNGQVVKDLIVGVKSINALKDKNGNTYYGVELMDKTGQINGKIWSDSLKYIDKAALAEDRVVSINAVVSKYRDILQMVIHKMSLASEDSYNYSDIIQVTQFGIENLWEELSRYVGDVTSSHLQKLIHNLIDKYGDELKVASGAQKLHHAYRGGLLEHILELLTYAYSLKKFYPSVDYDLVITGIIFHDIGKIRELSIGGLSINRTDLGKLKGHLIMSYDILHEVATEDMDKMLLLKLEHIILSHHGILEYGSPVMPKTMEAIIVHQVDELSAKVRQYARVVDENEANDNSFSQKDWAINTEVYLK